MTQPGPDRAPLPSAEDAERFFTEVPSARSAAASVHRQAASPAAPPTPAQSAPAPGVRHGASAVRRDRRTQVVAVLLVLVPLAAVGTSVLRGTSAPAAPRTVVAAVSGIPADVFGGHVCVRGMPPTTDGPFTEVPCSDRTARALVRGVTVLTTQDDAYPGPQEVDRLAQALCHLDFGNGIPSTEGDVLVSVPTEVGWSSGGARYVVCAEPAP